MNELMGFNNLTKALSFNLYDFAVALNDEERHSYVRYIDERYSARQIEAILIRIAETIDATVLNVSSKDFDPYGASVVLLMADEKGAQEVHGQPAMTAINIHLDKSHICAHTYPDSLDPQGICSFRVDIDIATCGTISPLYALDFMFNSFESDFVVVDYVVRGFTRTKSGSKIYMDHEIKSIADFISPAILKAYDIRDDNNPQGHTFQTKFSRRDLDNSTYFKSPQLVSHDTTAAKMKLIRREIDSLFHAQV